MTACAFAHDVGTALKGPFLLEPPYAKKGSAGERRQHDTIPSSEKRANKLKNKHQEVDEVNCEIVNVCSRQ